MHELSIMNSILRTCQEDPRINTADKIRVIYLEIGERSGVHIDALRFAFEVAAQETIAREATLKIEVIPFCGECMKCGHRFHAKEGFLICDRCGEYGRVTGGKEMNIKYIEVED